MPCYRSKKVDKRDFFDGCGEDQERGYKGVEMTAGLWMRTSTRRRPHVQAMALLSQNATKHTSLGLRVCDLSILNREGRLALLFFLQHFQVPHSTIGIINMIRSLSLLSSQPMVWGQQVSGTGRIVLWCSHQGAVPLHPRSFSYCSFVHSKIATRSEMIQQGRKNKPLSPKIDS